jgi:hypothetical protein
MILLGLGMSALFAMVGEDEGGGGGEIFYERGSDHHIIRYGDECGFCVCFFLLLLAWKRRNLF